MIVRNDNFNQNELISDDILIYKGGRQHSQT